MKKSNFFFTFALALLVIFQSCKKNEVAEVAAPVAQTENIAELQQAVAASFDISADKVIYNKSEKEFVVDGDGIVALQDAKDRFASSRGTASSVNGAAQRRYTYVVAASKVNAIRIYCDASVPAAWVAAVDSAIANWNRSGSRVSMQRVSTATTATTGILTIYNSTTNVVASASYPDSFGGVGKRVTLNTYFNSLSAAQKISAVTHELGHTLGLMHTNEAMGTLISGTPTTDTYSIMNAAGLGNSTLSSYDLMAVRKIYPL